MSILSRTKTFDEKAINQIKQKSSDQKKYRTKSFTEIINIGENDGHSKLYSKNSAKKRKINTNSSRIS